MDNSFEDQKRLDRARRKINNIRGFYKHLAAYVVINAFILVVHAMDMKPGEEFFAWSTFITALPWGLGLLIHGVSVFNDNLFLGQDWEDRKIRELMEKEHGKRSKWE